MAGFSTHLSAGAILIAAAACQAPDSAVRGQAAIGAAAGDIVEPRGFNVWERPGASGGNLTFVPLAERLPGGSVQLENGTVVDASDWPASLIADLPDGGSCTATLIGPRTILTAAHCVDLGKAPGAAPPLAGGGSVAINNQVFDLACEMDPSYAAIPKPQSNSPRSSRDYALCVLSSPVSVAAVRPESISTVPVQVNNAVLLAGYGCTNIIIKQVNGKEKLTYTDGDGHLRMGDETISYLGDRTRYEQTGVWATTESPGNEPTLCPGDSGGGVYQGATLANQRAARRVVAVNSAISWDRRNASYVYYSHLSPLGTPSFRNFLTDFVARKRDNRLDGAKLVVCGFNQNPGTGGCRA